MTDLDERVIRKRVEKRIKDRREFLLHLAIYVLVNMFLWVLYALIPMIMGWFGVPSDDVAYQIFTQFPWPLLIMVGWAIGLVAHGMAVWFQSGPAEAAKERAVQRAIARERERMGILEKPKRAYRLSDDGEIVAEEDTYITDDAQYINTGRRD